MSTIGLTGLYAREREKLARALGAQPDIDHVRSVLRRLFDNLAEAVEGDGRTQALAMLDALRGAMVGTVFAIRPAERPAFEPRNEVRSNTGGLFSLPWLSRPEPVRQPQENTQWRLPASPTFDSARLLDQLLGAFEAADRVLGMSQPPPPQIVEKSWSEDTVLLELFQDLLGTLPTEPYDAKDLALGDGDLALSHVERLRRSLEHGHGIKVITFDGTNGELFKGVAAGFSSGTEAETIKPALVADGRVLRFGEVSARAAPPAVTQAVAAAVPPAPAEAPVTSATIGDPATIPASGPSADSVMTPVPAADMKVIPPEAIPSSTTGAAPPPADSGQPFHGTQSVTIEAPRPSAPVDFPDAEPHIENRDAAGGNREGDTAVEQEQELTDSDPAEDFVPVDASAGSSNDPSPNVASGDSNESRRMGPSDD